MDTIFYIFHVPTTAPPRLARWSSERTFAKISQSRKKLLPGPSPGLLKAPTSTFIYKTLFLLWIWINASLAKCLKRFLNVEAVVASLNQLKALVGAFSLIVKTSRRFVASSNAHPVIGTSSNCHDIYCENVVASSTYIKARTRLRIHFSRFSRSALSYSLCVLSTITIYWPI